MRTWPKYPVIYEINTWVWLQELTLKYQRPIDLGTVPLEEWDLISSYGFDAVWLMGVWERSPAGIEISMRNKGLLEDFKRTLPGFSKKDNIGSPYCVRRYAVDEHLGGPKGLAGARAQLKKHGISLILDFVPNHVAPDHPWVSSHPEFFIQGNDDDLRRDTNSFVLAGKKVIACGRDPFFPAWPDVLQLNAFDTGLRHTVTDTISSIANQCDGIRCDMAMLVLNTIFERTWGRLAGEKPVEEYWKALILTIKKQHPEFKFIAEAYWDLEWELQQQGFDYCYDKKLYDRMEHGNAESVRQHLFADLSYQEKMVRFLENHDEPRASVTFPSPKGHAAAVALLTLPGAKLLHEGQFEGMKVRLPVFLGSRPVEPVDHNSAEFYKSLLKETNKDGFRSGEWQLSDLTGWPDNQSFHNILAWAWVKNDERYMIVINFSNDPSQARVHVSWDELRGKMWSLKDVLSGEAHQRNGDEIRNQGLYVELKAWKYNIFEFTPAKHFL